MIDENPLMRYLHRRQADMPVESGMERPAKAGRKKRRTPQHYAGVLEGYRLLRVRFIETHGRPPRTDVELFQDFRAHALATVDPHLKNAQDTQLGMSIKTARNVLAEARRHFRDDPGNRNGGISNY